MLKIYTKKNINLFYIEKRNPCVKKEKEKEKKEDKNLKKQEIHNIFIKTD